MPDISRRFIKTSLICFALALVAGIVQWGSFFGIEVVWLAGLRPAYIHLFIYGWITEMIIGVALWLFPIESRDRPRGNPWLNEAAWWGITVGLALRVVAEPAQSAVGGWAVVLVVAAVLQWIGGMAFVVNAWRRVKSR